MYTVNNMNEELKNSSLPDCDKLKIHFHNNPQETHTLTGEQIVDLIVAAERSAMRTYFGYKKEEFQKFFEHFQRFLDGWYKE